MKMQEETKLVYEKYGTSPTGGCLGSLIQFPILFALWPVIQNIPAYVTSIKDAYMPLVNQIMATDGYQKIMEGIGKASPIMKHMIIAKQIHSLTYYTNSDREPGIHLQINFRT